MKKLPTGVSNYEELIEEGYYYVDKTMYIEKLEDFSNKRIMFLRPRKFGKTLFTSTYDGYKFNMHAEKHLYNSNMCLYLLSDYVGIGRIPDSLIDVNIASDYSKLSHMLNICKSEEKIEIIEKTISGEGRVDKIYVEEC